MLHALISGLPLKMPRLERGKRGVDGLHNEQLLGGEASLVTLDASESTTFRSASSDHKPAAHFAPSGARSAIGTGPKETAGLLPPADAIGDQSARA
jgi:hypothetical protein